MRLSHINVEEIRVRLDAVAARALRRSLVRGTFRGGRVLSGLPVDDLADLALIGMVRILRGSVSFAEWSVVVARELGEAIRPHLRAVFDRARELAVERERAVSLDAVRDPLRLRKMVTRYNARLILETS